MPGRRGPARCLVATKFTAKFHGASLGQRVCSPDYPDMQWFRRGQRCQTCWRSWKSAEIDESRVNELRELRNMASELKASMEAYVEAADQAEKKLAAVRATLSELDKVVQCRPQT